MSRGVLEEPRAVETYARHFNREVTTAGLLVRDDWGFSIGYSPDGLVGDDGLVEVKSPRQRATCKPSSMTKCPPTTWRSCKPASWSAVGNGSTS